MAFINWFDWNNEYNFFIKVLITIVVQLKKNTGKKHMVHHSNYIYI